MSRSLLFDKYEGIGNDFIVVDAEDAHVVMPDLAVKLCDRRFGVGADGVILVLPPQTSSHAARMRVLNADGSVPEMCGNGIRCVALHVARTKPRARDEQGAMYETDAGVRTCRVEPAGANAPLDVVAAAVTVDMGAVRVLGERRLSLEGEESEWSPMDLIEVDVGNPHAVSLRKPSRADIERIGPRFAAHAAFGKGANIGFASIKDGNFIDLVVWERGAGLTLACGTGACAAVAAACWKGLIAWGTSVTVKLPGGHLAIAVEDDGGHARMRGPARHVFSGRVDVTE